MLSDDVSRGLWFDRQVREGVDAQAQRRRHCADAPAFSLSQKDALALTLVGETGVDAPGLLRLATRRYECVGGGSEGRDPRRPLHSQTTTTVYSRQSLRQTPILAAVEPRLRSLL